MKLRSELTDYIEANFPAFANVREVFIELDEEGTAKYDKRNYPLCEVSEDSLQVVQCLGGKTNFHISEVLISVSVMIDNARERSRNPAVRARSKTALRQVDDLIKSIEDGIDNLTFDTNGVYLQSCQLAGIEETFESYDNVTILTKTATFNCSYNYN